MTPRIEELPLVAPPEPKAVDVAHLDHMADVRPEMPDELVYCDLFDVYDAAVREDTGYVPTRWHASAISICPRLVWYRMKGLQPPVDLKSWAKMRIGSVIEGLEEALLDMALPRLNTRTIEDVLQDYPRLATAVEGALAARYVRDGVQVARFDPQNIRDHYILQLPFVLHPDELIMPIAGKVDAIVLIKDQPVILEIKSSYSYGIKHAREAAATGGGLKTAWVAQVALYTVALGLPAKLHAWARDDIYHTEFNMFWREGTFRVHGWPTEINGLDPVSWAIARLSWYEELVAQDEPPGDILYDDSRQAWVLDLNIPPQVARPDEEYLLLVSDDMKPLMSRGSKKQGTYIRSSWCHTCEAQSLCYQGLLNED